MFLGPDVVPLHPHHLGIVAPARDARLALAVAFVDVEGPLARSMASLLVGPLARMGLSGLVAERGGCRMPIGYSNFS